MEGVRIFSVTCEVQEMLHPFVFQKDIRCASFPTYHNWQSPSFVGNDGVREEFSPPSQLRIIEQF